jgi:hypothetical protein
MFQATSKNKVYILTQCTIITVCICVILYGGSVVFSKKSNSKLESERKVALSLADKKIDDLKQKIFWNLSSYTEDVIIDDNNTPDNPEDDIRGLLEVILRNRAGVLICGSSVRDDWLSVEVVISWEHTIKKSKKSVREKVRTFLTP